MAGRMSDYAYLWTEPGSWLLALPTGSRPPMQEIDGVPVAMVIEGDELAAEVVQRMIEAAGVLA